MTQITAEERARAARINERLAEVWEEVLRPARWRFYGPRAALQGKPASVYFWTTETVGGKYTSGVYHYYPRGKGGSGRASWVAERKVAHRTRKAAKARAHALYLKSQEGK